jgi:hypothetical protein
MPFVKVILRGTVLNTLNECDEAAFTGTLTVLRKQYQLFAMLNAKLKEC